MTANCIGCGREIPDKKVECPYCGASQSLILKYGKWSLMVGVAVVAVVLVARQLASVEVQSAVKQARGELAAQIQSLEESLSQQQHISEQLQQENAQLKNELDALKKQAAQTAAELSKGEQSLQKQLNNAKAGAKRHSDRASWLGRENARLKNEIAQLNQQLKTLKEASAQPPAPTQIIPEPAEPPVESPVEEKGDGQ